MMRPIDPHNSNWVIHLSEDPAPGLSGLLKIQTTGLVKIKHAFVSQISPDRQIQAVRPGACEHCFAQFEKTEVLKKNSLISGSWFCWLMFDGVR